MAHGAIIEVLDSIPAVPPAGPEREGGRSPSRERPMSEVEAWHTQRVLDGVDWHRVRAAQILGLSPWTLSRRIREFGLERHDD